MDPTIPDLKRAFLAAQVRILSAPLVVPPAESWRGVSGASGRDEDREEGGWDLEDRVVREAVRKANTLLHAHNTATFPPSALSHVAGQIDTLYWRNTTTSTTTTATHPSLPLPSRTTDLTDPEILQNLLEEWPESPEDEDEDSHKRKSGLESYAEAASYRSLVARLSAAHKKRGQARTKLETLRHLVGLCEELSDGNLQGELVVGRGAEAREAGGGEGVLGLSGELERMRVLAARVAGRVAAL